MRRFKVTQTRVEVWVYTATVEAPDRVGAENAFLDVINEDIHYVSDTERLHGDCIGDVPDEDTDTVVVEVFEDGTETPPPCRTRKDPYWLHTVL